MVYVKDSYILLQKYSQTKKSPDIDFAGFLSFFERWLEKHKINNPEYSRVRKNTSGILKQNLKELAKKEKCFLRLEVGEIESIYFPEYYLNVIKDAYKLIESKSETPFPTEKSLGITLPGNLITVINTKLDFIKELGKITPEDSKIFRLVFPENIESMIITSSLLSEKLLSYSMHKIRIYLDNGNNSHYMYHKLLGIFRQKEQSLRDMFNNILIRPGKVISEMKDAGEFSFAFWAHLGISVIQEYHKKDTKLQDENGYCQAGYLLGLYNGYFKGLVQKQKESRTALRTLDLSIHKHPYFFSLSDLYELKDSRGIPLIKKYSKEGLHKFLNERIRASEGKRLPEIIKLKTSDKKEYYIHSEVFLFICIKKIKTASVEYNQYYLQKWIRELKEYRTSSGMKNDEAFLAELKKHLEKEDPLLQAILNYNLLFLLHADEKDKRTASEILKLFDQKNKSLIPLNEIFGLKRDRIMAEAKLHLPLWEAIPIISRVVFFVLRLLKGIKEREKKRQREKEKKKPDGSRKKPGAVKLKKPDTPPSSTDDPPSDDASKTRSHQSRLAEYRKAIYDLKVQFIGKEKNISHELEFLIERWNPLYDPVRREDLVEDVNSMIRDFLRTMLRHHTHKAPDKEKIKELANLLHKNDAFDKIKKKEYLKQYIEVYIIDLLSRK